MTSKTTLDLLITRQFQSFEELAAITRQFDVDFRQLDASRHQHFVFQAQVDGVLVSMARFGCHVDQRGATPKKMRTFAFSEQGCPEMNWFGHRTGSEALLVFPTHGEIEVLSRPGFSETTFSVFADDLAEFFDRCGRPALDDLLTPQETVIVAPPRLLRQLRQLLRLVLVAAGNPASYPHLAENFRWRLFNILLEILRGNTGRRLEPILPRNRQLLKKVAEMVDTQSDDPIWLADLCAATEVPERTLINAFKQELGIPPKAYIKGHRLFRVHRELWNADPSATRISDVANARGFWHMGQFAADYKKLFGELPSDTLNRSGTSRII